VFLLEKTVSGGGGGGKSKLKNWFGSHDAVDSSKDRLETAFTFNKLPST
jgi:hypothetical protein